MAEGLCVQVMTVVTVTKYGLSEMKEFMRRVAVTTGQDVVPFAKTLVGLAAAADPSTLAAAADPSTEASLS